MTTHVSGAPLASRGHPACFLDAFAHISLLSLVPITLGVAWPVPRFTNQAAHG